MFAVETKQKKRENVCMQNCVLREQVLLLTNSKCHWNFIWVTYLKMVFIFLVFNIMRYKILIQAKVYMFAGSTC